MEQQAQMAASRMIESLTGWWELAGVDTAVGAMPVNWLDLDIKTGAAENMPVAPAFPPPPQIAPAAPAPPAADWPSTIDLLKTMIAKGAALPGNDFGPRPIMPVGPADCDVMVISDIPDRDELGTGTLGSGATGVLLERMLAAIGIKLSECYWTAMATTIPPAGAIPENALQNLADFARHQIGLVKPASLVLLGSAACQALLGEELAKMRAELRNLDHGGRNITVLATFHPRTLIARPGMKAQAWKDLQIYAKRTNGSVAMHDPAGGQIAAR